MAAAQRLDRQAVIRDLTTERPNYYLSAWGEKWEGNVIANDYSPEELRYEFILSGGNVCLVLSAALDFLLVGARMVVYFSTFTSAAPASFIYEALTDIF